MGPCRISLSYALRSSLEAIDVMVLRLCIEPFSVRKKVYVMGCHPSRMLALSEMSAGHGTKPPTMKYWTSDDCCW